jgi:hypothetical protein
MYSEETQGLLQESEILLKRFDKLHKFEDKYGITPPKESQELVESMQKLADSITDVAEPKTQDELIQSELKRGFNGEAVCLEKRLSGSLYDFDSILKIYSIPKEDITYLRTWLESNKDKTQETVERLFHSRDIEESELSLAVDIPNIARQGEEFAATNIQRYHKTLGKFLQSLTKVGAFLREIDAVATRESRSYFNSLTNRLAIGVQAICFEKEDGTLRIRDRELIQLYGHEGMGHALNYVVTRSAGLPYFLTQPSNLTSSTRESVAQFYENILLEDLKNSSETQKQLGIEHKFAEVYQEAKDTEQLRNYNKIITQYGISVLGDKSLGNPNDPASLRERAEKICEVAITRSYVHAWIQHHRHDFDSEGNLSLGLVGELRYCAKPVDRALQEFHSAGIKYDKEGRDIIDSTFLNGLWTPMGFVQNARIIAHSHKANNKC